MTGASGYAGEVGHLLVDSNGPRCRCGNIGCWEQEGRRPVGYWIGREFWGKGLATRALQELTGEVT